MSHKCGCNISPGVSQPNVAGYVMYTLWIYESVFLCRRDILIAMIVKIAVILNLMQLSMVDTRWHFRGTFCLHSQGTSLKMEAGLLWNLVHMFQTTQSHIPVNSNDQFLCWKASLSVLERKYAIWSIFFKLSSISSHHTTESSIYRLWGFLCTLNMKEQTAPPDPCPFTFHCHLLCTLTVCLILLN